NNRPRFARRSEQQQQEGHRVAQREDSLQDVAAGQVLAAGDQRSEYDAKHGGAAPVEVAADQGDAEQHVDDQRAESHPSSTSTRRDRDPRGGRRQEQERPGDQRATTPGGRRERGRRRGEVARRGRVGIEGGGGATRVGGVAGLGHERRLSLGQQSPLTRPIS